ncbi:MAG: hypothetical protein RL685_5790 [Pseudomonadota bacterium]|jgi:hypothetical protein
MSAFDRAWLARPILSALGCGTLVGLGCGGAVAPGSEYLDEMGGGIAQGGSAMAGGGTAGRGSTGGTGGSPASIGGTGGRTNGGSGGGGAGGVAGTGNGGDGGSSFPAGAGGVSGSAGSVGMAGSAGSVGMAGSAGSVGMAGSTSMDDPSICVSFNDFPSSAFPADDQTANDICGSFNETFRYEVICLPPAPGGLSCSSFYPEGLIGELYSCGLQQGTDIICGPSLPPSGSAGCAGNECCYVLAGGCPVGRPFLVHDEARTAESQPRTDWLLRQQPDVQSLDPATRCALADAYRKDGLSEHASVASFARFVLECLALGAPADLVLQAQAALADEIAHAQLSFGLASAYAGAPVGPGPLDVSDALVSAPDVRDSLRRALREGCIAETVSAALIRSASQAAEDPAVKTVLERVASDERRHAVLAWRFVRWLIAREGESLAVLAAEVLAEAPRFVGFGALTELSGDERTLRAHGYLSVAERRAIALQTLSQVVVPCGQALLRRNRPSRAPEGRTPESRAPDSSPASS